jgi:type IV secretion system protein VirB8
MSMPAPRPSLFGKKENNAATWAGDEIGAMRASQRTAWLVAFAALGVAAIEGVALAVSGPLRTVVPYTITVDRQTGYVETARGVEIGALSENDAMIQSFVTQYVFARETFDASDIRENYRKVMLWSAGDARKSYENELARSNPESPLVLYPASTILQVRIKSVSILSRTSAMVRFETVRRDTGAVMGDQRAYAAVMSFGFSGSAMRMEDRFINPLGFQITRYRRDPETAVATSVRIDTLGGVTQ